MWEREGRALSATALQRTSSLRAYLKKEQRPGGLSFPPHCPSGQRKCPWFLLCIRVCPVDKVLTTAPQLLQNLVPPPSLSSCVTTLALTHPMRAPLLSLKQASSAATPGPLCKLFSLMKCFPQLCTCTPGPPISGLYSNVTFSVWPSLTSL